MLPNHTGGGETDTPNHPSFYQSIPEDSDSPAALGNKKTVPEIHNQENALYLSTLVRGQTFS